MGAATSIEIFQINNEQQLSLQDKSRVARLEYEYHTIYSCLINKMKVHLIQMQKNYIYQINNDKSTLSFQRPILYYKELGKEEMTIILGNDYLAYSFLMFMQISTKDVYQFPPIYISFHKQSTKPYTSNDLLNAFKYTKKGLEIEPFETSKKGEKVPKEEVIEILRNDKQQVEQILKETFREHIGAYVSLKSAGSSEAKNVCDYYPDYNNFDYYLELFTCLEIFGLANNIEIPSSI